MNFLKKLKQMISAKKARVSIETLIAILLCVAVILVFILWLTKTIGK